MKGKKDAKKAKKKAADKKLCPECSSDNLFYSSTREELVCRDCGGIFSKLTKSR